MTGKPVTFNTIEPHAPVLSFDIRYVTRDQVGIRQYDTGAVSCDHIALLR